MTYDAQAPWIRRAGTSGGSSGTTRRRVTPAGGTSLAENQSTPISTPAPPPTPDLSDFEPRARSETVSRVFNCATAVVLVIVMAPVMAITAIAIMLASRGPVLYTQTRVGVDRRWTRTRALFDRRREDLGGTPFTIYKFRSMRVDAEPHGQAVWAAANDDRVTSVGRLIRKARIDELPQLFNVIRGDMNIVGPRPERPSIFVRLREQIDEYPVRQRVKPGITGLAQVSNPYDACLDDVRRKVAFDIQYMNRQSIVEDLRIMLLTIPVMIFRIGSR